MIGRAGRCVGLAVLLAASLASSKAQAQVFGTGGYGLGFYNYSHYDMPRIPHYALYPPVYYSYPVARPYGWSPFAYPPGVLTPEAPAKPKAAVYHNPHVPPKAVEPAADRTAATGGKMYYNPYVTQTASTAKRSLPQAN
jgi:hypothetical protein